MKKVKSACAVPASWHSQLPAQKRTIIYLDLDDCLKLEGCLGTGSWACRTFNCDLSEWNFKMTILLIKEKNSALFLLNWYINKKVLVWPNQDGSEDGETHPTRGPWWPWIAHLSQFPHKMNSTFSITIVPTYDPRDGASFDPRGIIWIELI